MKKNKLFAVCLVSFAVIFGGTFAGCNFGGESGNTGGNGGGNSSGNGKDDNTPKVEMTFNDLVKNHQTVAREFYENYLKSTLTAGRETKSESWYLNKSADDDKKVSSASMSFIYNVDDTTRALQVSRISFSPVSAQDIADSKVSEVNITDYSSNEVFRFDAKDNYSNKIKVDDNRQLFCLI